MLLLHIVCHWHKGCSVSLLFLTALMSHLLGGGGKKKQKKKNGTVVGTDCPSRAQSVCSLRCGMKSQRKPKECELSFCRLAAAAAGALRPFIARQRGKPPYHNKMEMWWKGELTKAEGFFFGGVCFILKFHRAVFRVKVREIIDVWAERDNDTFKIKQTSSHHWPNLGLQFMFNAIIVVIE